MRAGVLGLSTLAALAIAHGLLARWLDDAELIERLLAPGPDALVALPAALVLYALRLALMFVGPGAALISVLAIAWGMMDRRSERLGLDAGARARADDAYRRFLDHPHE